MKPLFKNTPWTLHSQLWTLLLVSGFMIVLLILLGGWWIQQINYKNRDLLESSQTLRNDLTKKFQNARSLTTLQNNLDLYMRSAPQGVLQKIHIEAETLRVELPEKLQVKLSEFIKKLDVLEIRMNSFRKNMDAVFASEQQIIQATEDLLLATPAAYHQQIRKCSHDLYRTHHHLYQRIILQETLPDLANTAQAYELLFKTIDKKLNDFKNLLPQKKISQLRKYQNSLTDLDKSLRTLIAIRRITLQTKNDGAAILSSLRTQVANLALSQTTVFSHLTRSGLNFFKKNLLAFSTIMVTMAVLGGLTAIILIHSIVTPLISLTALLQKMIKMLSGLRNENEFEEDFSTLIESIKSHKNNEIGQVTTSVKLLVSRLRELAIFRQDIEADESPDEIYRRMTRIFHDRLKLTTCLIFDSPDGSSFQLAHSRINLSGLEDLEMTLSKECRARRNKSIVNSFTDSQTCALFPLAEQYRHVCIPMQISGQVIGVVQFIFTNDDIRNNISSVTESLTQARHYIAEALPVIHAKRLTLRLQIMATEDPLTGLYNRHYLETSLDRIVAGAKRHNNNIYIFMCDIDYFKSINDNYGHDAGDLVLKQLAKVLTENVRETDFVIRFGGEEFMILLVDCDTQTSIEMAKRIQSQVEKAVFHIPGHTIQTTISIGTAIFPQHDEQNIWDCFKFADISLYQAKENGRNQVVHYNNSSVT